MAEIETRLIRTAAAARRADDAARDARATRDEVIAEAEELGVTLTAIAAHTGLSLAQVGRIAVAETGRRQQSEDPK